MSGSEASCLRKARRARSCRDHEAGSACHRPNAAPGERERHRTVSPDAAAALDPRDRGTFLYVAGVADRPAGLIEIGERAERRLVVSFVQLEIGFPRRAAGEAGLAIGAVFEVVIAVEHVEDRDQALDLILDQAADVGAESFLAAREA